MGFTIAASAAAHEIGTTRVSARIGASDYAIDLVVDPPSLLGRLESLAGQPRSGPLSSSEYQARIEALQQEFLSQVDMRFDGQRAASLFSYAASVQTDPLARELGPGPATIRLTGGVPSGARVLTWKYALTGGSYAFAVARDRAKPEVEWLEGAQISRPFALEAAASPLTRGRIAWNYFMLGFTHIVPKGLDHILFVLGLFFFSRRVRPMLWQVTAFTIAHSITLALSIYGVVRLAPAVVEPLIALSIAYVAIENIFTSQLKPWRVALVFAFGLLHGMGFAGVLGGLGLPRSEFLTALVTFNAGVEAGQLAVIAGAFLLVAHWTGQREWYRRRIVVPASATIALVGVYWTVQRLL
jgi:HupE/UreJ protein